MPNFEIKIADADLALMSINWSSDSVAFITQIDSVGKKQTIMLGPEEARQAIAVLDAYLNKKKSHASDCALHNSPAMEICQCDCNGAEMSAPP